LGLFFVFILPAWILDAEFIVVVSVIILFYSVKKILFDSFIETNYISGKNLSLKFEILHRKACDYYGKVQRDYYQPIELNSSTFNMSYRFHLFSHTKEISRIIENNSSHLYERKTMSLSASNTNSVLLFSNLEKCTSKIVQKHLAGLEKKKGSNSSKK
jgi:hypothetical protein